MLVVSVCKAKWNLTWQPAGSGMRRLRVSENQCSHKNHAQKLVTLLPKNSTPPNPPPPPTTHTHTHTPHSSEMTGSLTSGLRGWGKIAFIFTWWSLFQSSKLCVTHSGYYAQDGENRGPGQDSRSRQTRSTRYDNLIVQYTRIMHKKHFLRKALFLI